MAEEEGKNPVVWPDGAEKVENIADFEFFMAGRKNEPVMKIEKEKLNEFIVVNGEGVKAVAGGATSATPTILRPGPGGANRKMEDVEGWFVNGTPSEPPVATGAPWLAPVGFKNVNWWDGTSKTWSLVSSVPLPKGADGLSANTAYNSNENNLAAAILGILPENRRQSGDTITFKDVNRITQTYRYVGQYYQKLAYESVDSWIDTKNEGDYEIFYFTHVPDIRTAVSGKTINTSNVIVDSSDPNNKVTDFIEITALTRIASYWLGRYISYDASKSQIGGGIMNSGVTFDPSTVKYVKISFQNANIAWKYGPIATSTVPAAEQKHVIVVKNHDRIVKLDSYNPNVTSFQGTSNLLGLSPAIPVKVGDRITSIDKTTGLVYASGHNYRVFAFNAAAEYINVTMSAGTFDVTAGIDHVYISMVGNISNIFSTVYSKNGSLILSKAVLKKWHIDGDSISNWIDYAIKGYGWLISQKFNLRSRNRAVSGQTSAQVLTRVQGYDFSDVDVFTMMIGTNDFAFNVSTAAYKANLIAIVNEIRTKNPATKIGLFTILKRNGVIDSTANSTGSTMAQFNNAIKEVGLEQNIAILDLRNECQLNPNVEVYRTMYTVSGDGTHPNNTGHELFLAPLISEFVRKLTLSV